MPNTTSAISLDLPDDVFQSISDRMQALYGIHLPPEKKPLVHSRLARRVRSLRLGSFDAYLTFLEAEDNAAERLEMLAALTTNVTSFFREAHHFRILAEQVFANRPSKAPPIKIWSAGCSTGAEPVSAAITWLENGGTLDGLRILGTDIDHKILRKAGLGEYSKSEVANLSPDRLEKFFSQTKHGNFKTSHAVQSLMTFRSLNLNEPFPFSGKFDAIFCRNVAIYFDEPTQARLWDKLSDCLMPGGVLFIGHSERLDPKTSSKLKNIGITAYQRHINGE